MNSFNFKDRSVKYYVKKELIPFWIVEKWAKQTGHGNPCVLYAMEQRINRILIGMVIFVMLVVGMREVGFAMLFLYSVIALVFSWMVSIWVSAKVENKNRTFTHRVRDLIQIFRLNPHNFPSHHDMSQLIDEKLIEFAALEHVYMKRNGPSKASEVRTEFQKLFLAAKDLGFVNPSDEPDVYFKRAEGKVHIEEAEACLRKKEREEREILIGEANK